MMRSMICKICIRLIYIKVDMKMHRQPLYSLIKYSKGWTFGDGHLKSSKCWLKGGLGDDNQRSGSRVRIRLGYKSKVNEGGDN